MYRALAGYTSSVDVLDKRRGFDAEVSSKTSSSIPSAMGFIFVDVLELGDFSTKQNIHVTEHLESYFTGNNKKHMFDGYSITLSSNFHIPKAVCYVFLACLVLVGLVFHLVLI